MRSRNKNGSERVRYRAIVALGDKEGVIGWGDSVGRSEEAAISAATTKAILHKLRIALGSQNYANIHTVAFRVKGKCGNVKVVINPAPEGVGFNVPPVVRKLLHLSGITDCYLNISGDYRRYNINLAMAVFNALKKLDSRSI